MQHQTHHIQSATYNSHHMRTAQPPHSNSNVHQLQTENSPTNKLSYY